MAPRRKIHTSVSAIEDASSPTSPSLPTVPLGILQRYQAHVVCPACRGPLVVPEDGSLSHLRCLACEVDYPFVAVAPDVYVLDLRSADPDSQDVGFSKRWEHNPRPQPGEANFRLKTGLVPSDIAGKIILDVGCGVGQFVDVVLAWGAALVIAADISVDAIRALVRTFPDDIASGRLLPVLASGLRFIVAPRYVDVAYSIGVLHHTPDPRRGFLRLAESSSDIVSVWVYSEPVSEPRWIPALAFLHEVTSALTKEVLYRICEKYAVSMRDAYMGVFDPLMQVLRVSNQPDADLCVSDTFDWHAPQYRSWHAPEEVQQWFLDAGFTPGQVISGGHPVSFTGRRVIAQ